MEAKARVNSLSDAEVVRLSEQIEQLPAGGGVDWLTVFLVACFATLLVLFVIGIIDVVK